MRSDNVRLFQTLPHACGYFAARTAQNLVIDPAAPHLDKLYGAALDHGFRRAGGHLYFPHCPGCRACTPCRIDVLRFKPDRSQKRNLKRNADLTVSERMAGYNSERHALYARYLRSRHPGGGMDEAEASDFRRFLTAPWSPTVFMEIHRGEQLLAVAVTDVCATGVSSVYTFYEPDEIGRGLGTFAILQQVELARRRNIPWVYLGFWIEGHPKMDYKRRFQPLQVRNAEGWSDLRQPSAE